MMAQTQRPFASRLAIRLSVIMALAMLPAGIIAFVQTSALEREVKSRSEVALMGATLHAAAAQTGLIRRARGIVGTLATSLPFVLEDPEACTALMERTALIEPAASLVAFVPPSGLMTCSSVGRPYDFSDNPLFKQVSASREPAFIVNPNGPVSGTSVLGIINPVFGADGAYLGYAVMSLPHNALDDLKFDQIAGSEALTTPIVFWTFDGKGQLLTANSDLEFARNQLPAQRPLKEFVGTDARVFGERSMSGRSLTYAVVAIVPNELYLMSSFVPEGDADAGSHRLVAYLPTVLMWLVGLIVSGFAADTLVTRHVRTLNRSMVSFAKGDRRLQSVDLNYAPAELQELAEAYGSMTDNIIRSEADLEDTVHQKEVLLREVHHRVKNNLQLISSIMNIQIRSARGGEAKNLLKNLQERIMSLATVHRGLYQTSGLADVRARELIPDIVRQIMTMSSGPEKPFETQSEIDDLRLVPDQAVPLSLLLTEALTNAIKHAGAARGHPARLAVRLKREGGSGAVLEVANSCRVVQSDADTSTGIGSQLIAAFVQQLGGTLDATQTDTSYVLRVTFTVSPLALAENRQVSPAGDSY